MGWGTRMDPPKEAAMETCTGEGVGGASPSRLGKGQARPGRGAGGARILPGAGCTRERGG